MSDVLKYFFIYTASTLITYEHHPYHLRTLLSSPKEATLITLELIIQGCSPHHLRTPLLSPKDVSHTA